MKQRFMGFLRGEALLQLCAKRLFKNKQRSWGS
ncbi:hypothetical protein X926_09165 [Petrotoga sp. HWHPT.55.6.3]|nr:hypothetical protein X926_09165 [Petrotoga sp. HWHPT.55.6.3]